MHSEQPENKFVWLWDLYKFNSAIAIPGCNLKGNFFGFCFFTKQAVEEKIHVNLLEFDLVFTSVQQNYIFIL